MSQHNIIGSEAFEGKRYIMVRKVRSGVRQRRRRNSMMLLSVAIIALIIGALVAVFALAPLLMQQQANAAPVAQASTADADTQTPLRLQPVERGLGQQALNVTTPAPNTATVTP